MPDQPDVRVGQVWEDADTRSPGRRIKVVRLDEIRRSVWDQAECRYVDEVIPVAVCRRLLASGGLATRETRIRIDRFRPGATGYRLVEDVAEAASA